MSEKTPLPSNPYLGEQKPFSKKQNLSWELAYLLIWPILDIFRVCKRKEIPRSQGSYSKCDLKFGKINKCGKDFQKS